MNPTKCPTFVEIENLLQLRSVSIISNDFVFPMKQKQVLHL